MLDTIALFMGPINGPTFWPMAAILNAAGDIRRAGRPNRFDSHRYKRSRTVGVFENREGKIHQFLFVLHHLREVL